MKPQNLKKRGFLGALAGLRRNRGGNITIEFAFMAPLMVLLTMGTFEMGRLILEQLRVTNAAQAGVRYGAYDLSTAADTAGIMAAATAQVGPEVELSVTSRTFCLCDDGSEVACGTTCPSEQAARRYVEVAVAREMDLFFSYPVTAGPFHLESLKSIRVN